MLLPYLQYTKQMPEHFSRLWQQYKTNLRFQVTYVNTTAIRGQICVSDAPTNNNLNTDRWYILYEAGNQWLRPTFSLNTEKWISGHIEKWGTFMEINSGTRSAITVSTINYYSLPGNDCLCKTWASPADQTGFHSHHHHQQHPVLHFQTASHSSASFPAGVHAPSMSTLKWMYGKHISVSRDGGWVGLLLSTGNTRKV